jgi:hypothetical protein
LLPAIHNHLHQLILLPSIVFLDLRFKKQKLKQGVALLCLQTLFRMYQKGGKPEKKLNPISMVSEIHTKQSMNEETQVCSLIAFCSKTKVVLRHWIRAVCLYWTALKTPLTIYRTGGFSPCTLYPDFYPPNRWRIY